MRRDMSGDHELHRRRGYVRLRVREAPVSSYRRFPPEQVRVHLHEARQIVHVPREVRHLHHRHGAREAGTEHLQQDEKKCDARQQVATLRRERRRTS